MANGIKSHPNPILLVKETLTFVPKLYNSDQEPTMEKAKIKFYRVQRCGYYQRGAKKPDFGTISETIDELIAWSHGKDLGQTCPYQIENGEQFLGTFCFSIIRHSSNADALLVTWNQVPATNNLVASVDATSKVGAATVNLTKTPKNSIPGFATYFWLVPEHSVLATVGFQHPLNGHQAFQKFMREFLAKYTKFTVINTTPSASATEIVGYRQSSDDIVSDLLPSFHSVSARRHGKIEFLKKNQRRIVRIVRKNTLNPSGTNRKPSLSRAFREDLGLPIDGTAFNTSHVRYEVRHSPNPTELDTIITTWEEDYETQWDDVGFKLSNDPETYWLSHTLLKREVDLEVQRDNEEIVNAASLLVELEKRRTELLRELS
jgi:hypothetical protein